MENDKYLEILSRIELLVKNNAKFEATEYIELEINNLKNKSHQKCKNTIYYYDYCNYCSNKNCIKYENQMC